MKEYLLVLSGILLQISLSGQTTGSWGDQGNGTYINPVLNSDYSDPDVIRVGNKYYRDHLLIRLTANGGFIISSPTVLWAG